MGDSSLSDSRSVGSLDDRHAGPKTDDVNAATLGRSGRPRRHLVHWDLSQAVTTDRFVARAYGNHVLEATLPNVRRWYYRVKRIGGSLDKGRIPTTVTRWREAKSGKPSESTRTEDSV
jgi:hypothetical protein